MTRILILLFLLNTFMLPASAAKSACGMMSGSSSSMMQMQNMADSDDQSNMSCDMDTAVACSSVDCVSSCAISIIPLSFSDKNPIIIVAGHIPAQAGSAYFYNIVLPIQTPPPLV